MRERAGPPGAQPDAEKRNDDAKKQQSAHGHDEQYESRDVDGHSIIVLGLEQGGTDDEAEIVGTDDIQQGADGHLACLAKSLIAFPSHGNIAARR